MKIFSFGLQATEQAMELKGFWLSHSNAVFAQ